MTLRRFYSDLQLQEGKTVEFTGDEAEHIRKSLRMQSGDPILVFNGETEFTAELTEVSKERVTARLLEMNRESKSSREITLFQSLIKPANFELVIQKSTELGVANIVPMATEYSQLKTDLAESKHNRWEKIILEACKQSERVSIPTLQSAVTYEQALEQATEFDLVILLAVPRDSEQVQKIGELTSRFKAANNIAVIVGPEGGFSPGEIKMAESRNIPLLSIGKLVLKSETAAIAGITLSQFLMH